MNDDTLPPLTDDEREALKIAEVVQRCPDLFDACNRLDNVAELVEQGHYRLLLVPRYHGVQIELSKDYVGAIAPYLTKAVAATARTISDEARTRTLRRRYYVAEDYKDYGFVQINGIFPRE